MYKGSSHINAARVEYSHLDLERDTIWNLLVGEEPPSARFVFRYKRIMIPSRKWIHFPPANLPAGRFRDFPRTGKRNPVIIFPTRTQRNVKQSEKTYRKLPPVEAGISCTG
jgi:hypothetical protein